jgi:5-methyltetrahydrofolate--homocysteine methyltransferase
VKKILRPKAVYQFFRATGEGNSISLWDDRGRPLAQMRFPRQNKRGGFCLADYISPIPAGQYDNLALFVVTAGEGIRELSEKWKREGAYLKSHALQALALETAEAYAEYLHSRLRTMWGFPDPVEMSMMERFQAKYRGKRYSFGYPACPDLAGQQILWDLLHPEEIGVGLTEGMMMEPEASVSALVFHHPQCEYFTAG